MVTARKVGFWSSLENRNFRWFWANTTAQAMGMGMQFFVLGWLVLDLTGSSSKLGLVISLYGISNLAFVLFGGLISDRLDRRWLVFFCQAGVTAFIFLLATLVVTDKVALWHIYLISFVLGTIQALNLPARMALVPDLVSRDLIMNAVALNSAMLNSGRIIGPALGGGVVEVAGISAALYLNAGLYGASALCLLPIRSQAAPRMTERTGLFAELQSGIRYTLSTPVTLTVIGIGFCIGFFAFPHIQVLPAFAKDVLDAGAGEAGLLLMAAGLGSLFGSLALAAMGGVTFKNRLLIATALGFGITLFAFAWSPWYWVSWVLLLFVGLVSMGYVTLGTTVLQMTTPRHVQGRVMSLWTASAALMFVGALPMGVVSDWLSWPIAMGGGAAISLAFALWLGVLRPTLRQLRI